jgi:hypothetical protein
VPGVLALLGPGSEVEQIEGVGHLMLVGDAGRQSNRWHQVHLLNSASGSGLGLVKFKGFLLSRLPRVTTWGRKVGI